MLFYYLISALRKFLWLFRIPTPTELAVVDVNSRCPVCGARAGRIRCVLQIAPGPRAKDTPPSTVILCQHICNVCGARWHEKPLGKGITPQLVLPSVARNDLEVREDRQARLQTNLENEETTPST